MANVLARLVDFMVITFGITRPRPGQEKLAGLFILGLIAGIALIILTGVVVLVRALA